MPKRSYFEETTEMSATWETLSCQFTMITEHLNTKDLMGTAYCVGSGGSLVLAKLWEYLHEELGLGFAKTVTPYEFNYVQKKSDLVVIFSASGKNHDILQAFKTAIQRGSKVLIFTITTESALFRLVKSHPLIAHAVYPENAISKDGFLAVNSTIAMLRLIMHFLNKFFSNKYADSSPIQLAIDHHMANPVSWEFTSNPTIQIIASDYGFPAGVDLETKLAESGVASGFLTDPRNFGHGRFIWLAKHPKETKVVLINTLRSQYFMKRFEKSLPEYIECYRINAPYDGLLGAIYCIARTILLFGDLAKKRKMDPGKPDVPDWGRKLHSLRLGQRELQSIEVPKHTSDYEKYPALTSQFSGIVMDLDGTLIDTKKRFGSIKKEIGEEINRLIGLGLRFGFSTGRGDSALALLKEHISSEFWDNILIGLYNGTLLMKLSDDFQQLPENIWPTGKILDSLLRPICNELKIHMSSRLTQITIRDLTFLQREYIKNELYAHLGQRTQFVKILTTGHSLDILPHWSTKLTVVEAMAKDVDENILCVGDQGQIAGNDEDLLKWMPSVSVGSKRPASNSCFWLGHNRNLQESNGTLALLSAIETKKNLFIINSAKLTTCSL